MNRDSAQHEESAVETIAELCRSAEAAASPLEDLGRAGRARFLEDIAAGLEAQREALISIARSETFLGEQRLSGELTRTAFQLRVFAGVLREGGYLGASIDHTAETPMGTLPDLRRIQVPLGPVAVYAASNFPFAFGVVGGDTASALSAGCPVIAKAHPSQPRTAEHLAEVVAAAIRAQGLPEGTYQLVTGLAEGVALVRDPRITAAGFTGSIRGGRALFDHAAQRPAPIPFYGELGSVNPVLITEAAAEGRGDVIARNLAASMTLGVGQFCTKPGLFFVPDGSSGRALSQRIGDEVRQVVSSPMLNDGIAGAYDTERRRREHDSRLRLVGEGEGDQPAAVFDVAADELHDQLLEESFGPGALIVRYRSLDEAMAAIARLGGQLTATLHSEPHEGALQARVARFFRDRAGRLVFNGYPTGVGVSWSMHHGGPYPASTASSHTSVGPAAIQRWLRAVSYQDAPEAALPEELREGNPAGIPLRVDGVLLTPGP